MINATNPISVQAPHQPVPTPPVAGTPQDKPSFQQALKHGAVGFLGSATVGTAHHIPSSVRRAPNSAMLSRGEARAISEALAQHPGIATTADAMAFLGFVGDRLGVSASDLQTAIRRSSFSESMGALSNPLPDAKISIDNLAPPHKLAARLALAWVQSLLGRYEALPAVKEEVAQAQAAAKAHEPLDKVFDAIAGLTNKIDTLEARVTLEAQAHRDQSRHLRNSLDELKAAVKEKDEADDSQQRGSTEGRTYESSTRGMSPRRGHERMSPGRSSMLSTGDHEDGGLEVLPTEREKANASASPHQAVPAVAPAHEVVAEVVKKHAAIKDQSLTPEVLIRVLGDILRAEYTDLSNRKGRYASSTESERMSSFIRVVMALREMESTLSRDLVLKRDTALKVEDLTGMLSKKLGGTTKAGARVDFLDSGTDLEDARHKIDALAVSKKTRKGSAPVHYPKNVPPHLKQLIANGIEVLLQQRALDRVTNKVDSATAALGVWTLIADDPQTATKRVGDIVGLVFLAGTLLTLAAPLLAKLPPSAVTNQLAMLQIIISAFSQIGPTQAIILNGAVGGFARGASAGLGKDLEQSKAAQVRAEIGATYAAALATLTRGLLEMKEEQGKKEENEAEGEKGKSGEQGKKEGEKREKENENGKAATT